MIVSCIFCVSFWEKVSGCGQKGLTCGHYPATVEENFLKLAKHDQVFMKDAYEAILLLISGSKLPFIGCQTHQTSLMSDVIFQYLTLRFRCFGKKRFVDVVEKKRGEQHARIKMKKLRTFARK